MEQAYSLAVRCWWKSEWTELAGHGVRQRAGEANGAVKAEENYPAFLLQLSAILKSTTLEAPRSS